MLSELASTIGAMGVVEPDGTMNVEVGGMTLVQGAWSDTMQGDRGAPAT